MVAKKLSPSKSKTKAKVTKTATAVVREATPPEKKLPGKVYRAFADDPRLKHDELPKNVYSSAMVQFFVRGVTQGSALKLAREACKTRFKGLEVFECRLHRADKEKVIIYDSLEMKLKKKAAGARSK